MDSSYDSTEKIRNLFSTYKKVGLKDISDIMYGVMLSNYINDKNINDIQLTKREYIL